MINSTVTFSSGASGPPDLRFLHYNDVYHVFAGAEDPVGGVSRFITQIKHYQESPEFDDLPPPLTFFSGDAFNPSMESSVTKGSHMPPILNIVKTDVACLGNHDLDFGVEKFMELAKLCKFPWLCANIVDPAVEGPIGKVKRTQMLESNGVKVGVIGLVEKEWLDTIRFLPPNLQFTEPSSVVKELVPQLKAAGAEIIVAVCHQREDNDNRLAREVPPGHIDILLGGHDHYYAHEIINGCHVLRSGSDFKQFSYIEARRKSKDGSIPGWHFDIIRRDITADIQEDPAGCALVDSLSSVLEEKYGKPIGFTSVPLETRFTVIRTQESNMGNFTADLLRYYYSTDCAIINAGGIRSDRIFPPGVLKVRDILSCFPFEDPVMVVKVPGFRILEALEHGVSRFPATEGRFPQVSNISLVFDASRIPGSRIVSCKIGGEDVIPDKKYTCASRGYMVKGGDGFKAFTVESGAEEIVDEENGILIPTIFRQYFTSLKVVGKWRTSGVFHQFYGGLKQSMIQAGQLEKNVAGEEGDGGGDGANQEAHKQGEQVPELVRKAGKKWARAAGLKNAQDGGEIADWTRSVAPVVEGRIQRIG